MTIGAIWTFLQNIIICNGLKTTKKQSWGSHFLNWVNIAIIVLTAQSTHE